MSPGYIMNEQKTSRVGIILSKVIRLMKKNSFNNQFKNASF